MFCYLHFPTTNSPLRSSEPISYYIYFTSQPFRKYKKTSPFACTERRFLAMSKKQNDTFYTMTHFYINR